MEICSVYTLMVIFLSCLLSIMLPLHLLSAGGEDLLYKIFRSNITDVSPSEYGGQPQIWSIETDGDGFTYLAAGSNLAVWNGYVWSTYSAGNHHILRHVHYDNQTGLLYCCGDNFFGYWRRRADREMELVILYSNSDLSRHEIFWRIFPYGEDILVQTHNALYRFSGGKTDKIAGKSVGYMIKSVDNLYVQIEDTLFRITDDGLYRVYSGIKDRIVLVDDIQEGILVVGENTGFSLISTGRNGEVSMRTVFSDAGRVLADLRIFCAEKGNEGTYLVGTVIDGAYVVGADGKIIDSYTYSSGFSHTTVLSIKEDDSGRLLLGADGGFSFVTRNSPCRFYSPVYGHIGYVYSASVWNGALYLATSKGLFEVDPNTGVPRMVSGSQGQVWSLKPMGQYLAVVADNGLRLLDKDGKYDIIAKSVWMISPVPGYGGLYCASDDEGLSIFGTDGDGRLCSRNRLGNYSNPNNNVHFDKFGYMWIDGLIGHTKRLLPDMDYREVRECRTYKVGPDGNSEMVDAFMLDGEMIFTSGTDCYTYSPRTDTIMFNSYYTELFSHFSASDLKLYQRGNLFFNYDGKTVDVLRRVGNDISVRRDIFSSTGFGHLPSAFREVFEIEDGILACGFSESIGILSVDSIPDTRDVSVVLDKIYYYSKTGRHNAVPGDRIVLPYGTSGLGIELCTNPRTNLDYRVDDGPWSAVPEDGPLMLTYLDGGLHRISFRSSSSDILLSVDVTVRRHFIFRWWFVSCVLLVIVLCVFAVRTLYRQRVSRIRENMEKRQNELLEKEQITHRNEILSIELKERDKKLSMLSLNDITVNNMLDEILGELDSVVDSGNIADIRKVRKCIERYKRDNGSWKIFEQYFNGIFDGFFDRLLAKYPKLTKNDMKICAYVKLGMNTKEIAGLMNIEISSAESARYRLRKNMGLSQSDSLTEIISKI